MVVFAVLAVLQPLQMSFRANRQRHWWCICRLLDRELDSPNLRVISGERVNWGIKRSQMNASFSDHIEQP